MAQEWAPWFFQQFSGAQNIAVIQSPDASPIQETAYREFSRLTALIMGRAPLQVKENVLDHVRERTTDIVLIGDSALSNQIMRDNNISPRSNYRF
ncbi:MAG: hypothetical protein CM1200mP3_14920 [Chloroflexota bacterium]|nr:MAG: hypothetical protein CM1200mP3_14920 [Chloroflexota bacterium]